MQNRTDVRNRQINKENKSLQNASNPRGVPDTCLNRTLSLAFFVVKDSAGIFKGYQYSDIQPAVDELNKDFAPICLSFKVCSVDTVLDYNYDKFEQDIDGKEVVALFDKPKTINIYLVESITSKKPSPGCGYTWMPEENGPSHIILRKACLTDKMALSHEMGHFFGLYNTFETTAGQGPELVNRNNCENTGDLLCDTEADPGFGGCTYTGTTKDTPNGSYYYPLIGNIMSMNSPTCKCGFTTDQFNRMAKQFLTPNRKNLY